MFIEYQFVKAENLRDMQSFTISPWAKLRKKTYIAITLCWNFVKLILLRTGFWTKQNGESKANFLQILVFKKCCKHHPELDTHSRKNYVPCKKNYVPCKDKYVPYRISQVGRALYSLYFPANLQRCQHPNIWGRAFTCSLRVAHFCQIHLFSPPPIFFCSRGRRVIY
jgi:hypothetical protein